MSVYVTNDTDLTAVADAIRNKANTTEGLTFPNGFVSAINDISASAPSGARIKYLIPASFVPVRTADNMGFDAVNFTFTRENVNQAFQVSWRLQDAINFNDSGYWTQLIHWNMHLQGNYASKSNINCYIEGAGGRGNLPPTGSVRNFGKTSLTGEVSLTNTGFTTTNVGYERWGQNYKGLIIITDTSYTGKPIIDESKLAQYFTNCNGQLTAGW